LTSPPNSNLRARRRRWRVSCAIRADQAGALNQRAAAGVLREAPTREIPMIRLATLLAAVLATSASHASQVEHFTAAATGKLTIGADGSVLDVELAGTGPGGLGKSLEEGFKEHIRAWRFEPVIEDGKPVNAIGHMRLSLVATRVKGAKEATLGVRRVWFMDPPSTKAGTPGASPVRHMPPPVYPQMATSQGIGAEVTLALRIGAEGSVAEVGTYSLALTGNVPSKASTRERYARSLRQSAERAARDWNLAGLEEGAVVLAPVRYSLRGVPTWSLTVAVPTQAPAWAVSSRADKTALALSDRGQSVSTRIKLSTALEDPVDPAGDS